MLGQPSITLPWHWKRHFVKTTLDTYICICIQHTVIPMVLDMNIGYFKDSLFFCDIEFTQRKQFRNWKYTMNTRRQQTDFESPNTSGFDTVFFLGGDVSVSHSLCVWGQGLQASAVATVHVGQMCSAPMDVAYAMNLGLWLKNGYWYMGTWLLKRMYHVYLCVCINAIYIIYFFKFLNGSYSCFGALERLEDYTGRRVLRESKFVNRSFKNYSPWNWHSTWK